MAWGFVAGQEYNRKEDIHGVFGGQPRPGIITPRNHAVIFLISGHTGLKHGYDDKFHADGRVEYFGVGTKGDMKMKGGNAAIANHSAEGKSLLLFKRLRGKERRLIFHGEMICEEHREVNSRDRNDAVRRAIVFDLRPLTSIMDDLEGSKVGDDRLTLDELRKLAFAAAKPRPGKRQSITNIFERSRAVRDYVVRRAAGHCEGCELPAPFQRPDGSHYLEPHHIKRLSDGGPDDPRLVIALCPNCHRRVHAGSDGPTFNDALLKLMAKIEPKVWD